MRTALFLVPNTWTASGYGPDGKPTNTLPIWTSCQVGNEPRAGGSIPYLELPPDTIGTIVNCPESRWSIVIGTAEWQLLHEYDANQIVSLQSAPMMVSSIIGARGVAVASGCSIERSRWSRRQFLAAVGITGMILCASVHADKPLTTANKEKIEKWIKDRKEKTWTTDKMTKAMDPKADTTRKLAKQVVTELLKWPDQAAINSRLW